MAFIIKRLGIIIKRSGTGNLQLLNSSPPGFASGMKSMAQKQLTVNKIIENKGLSAVNQLLRQAKGLQRLKAHIQKALNQGL